MKTLFTLILPVIVLTGCSIQQWQGKSRDSLLMKKGMPDKVENNGEDQVYYYCTPEVRQSMVYVDRQGNAINGTLMIDTSYTYEVFAIQKSNTIFFVAEEYSYLAPKKFTVLEE